MTDDTSSSSSPGDAARVSATIDPRKPTIVTILGKKGSGKSVLARRLWETYPYDRLAIDPHNDLHEEGTRDVRDPLPARWPMPLEDEERTSLRYVPDPGAKTYLDDLDRAVGLAYMHRHVLLWLDEINDLTSANFTPPFMKRALYASRHRQLSMLMCGPRALNINPLILSQADLVYIFDLPSVRDRARVAQTIGYPEQDFDDAVHDLGPFEYLRWDGHELVQFPPLPFTRRPSDREAQHASEPLG